MKKLKDKNGLDVWVATTYDCEPNLGGYYCTMYADEDMNHELGFFTISAESVNDGEAYKCMRDTVKCLCTLELRLDKRKIAHEMEKLVHHRFSHKSLVAKLKEIFGVPIILYHDEPEANELLGDYCWGFAIGDNFGVFEIYYLPHRRTDGNGNSIYVTEVGYSFGC